MDDNVAWISIIISLIIIGLMFLARMLEILGDILWSEK